MSKLENLDLFGLFSTHSLTNSIQDIKQTVGPGRAKMQNRLAKRTYQAPSLCEYVAEFSNFSCRFLNPNFFFNLNYTNSLVNATFGSGKKSC